MTCAICGVEFTPKNPKRPAKTCSRACTNKMVWRTTPKRRCGPKPQDRVIADCEWCGKPVKWAQRPGRQGRFCSRRCAGRAKSRGGLGVFGPSSSMAGRTYVRLRGGSKQLYSRCLMEGHLGRDLTWDEIVHHINEDPTDDRIENLEVVARREHPLMHREAMLAGIRNRSTTKLTQEQATYIRGSTERTSVLARRFGVTEGAIVYHRGALLKSGRS